MSEDQINTAPETTKKTGSLGVPVAIVIAALLIGGAIYFSGNKTTQKINVAEGIKEAQNEQNKIEVAPVTQDDMIRGNPNAPILVVEYSDFDCPFCKNFHETMKQIMTKYGENGKVAWIYRNFPLQQLHPNAPKLAEAGHCVAEIGGNDAFWKFSDNIFENRETNAQTDMTQLPAYAVAAGVDKDKFNECFTSGKYASKVEEDIQAALKAGAQGTPYSIVMVGDQQGVINGAQPFETVDKIMQTLISQLEGKPATTTTE